MSLPPLPSFAKPPVVETVLGVQFDPIAEFTNAHLGAFWSALGADWPTVRDAPPLDMIQERFGDEREWMRLGIARFSITDVPAARVLISNRQADRMIQVQNGRLHYNWIGGETGSAYARYDKIRPEFLRTWDAFLKFLVTVPNGEKLVAACRPNSWEVTYVNQIPRGTVWDSPADWGKIFVSPLVPPTQLTGCTMEGLNAEWVYEIESKRGRLRIQMNNGRTAGRLATGGNAGLEVLVLKLTARGQIDEAKGWNLAGGIDLGRDIIVNAFRDLASPAAKAFWEEQA